MRHIILFLVLTFSQILWAQRHRFTYEYQYTLDSTKADKLTKTYMILDITPNQGSYFYEEKTFKKDSAWIEKARQSKFNAITTLGKNFITDVVEKQYPDYNTTWHTNIDQIFLRVKENPKQDWALSNDTETIEGYPCQKATTDFGGRYWTAWFTTEIPFPEGPYKFHGLPGLIVKLESQDHTHQFLLKGSKKLLPEDLSWDYIKTNKESLYHEKPIEVNTKQYVKLYQEYVNDPVKDLKQKLSTGRFRMVIEDENGKETSDPQQVIRMYEEIARKDINSNNNPIEKNLR